VSEPFKDLGNGVTGKPFWITGKLWNRLITALIRDRIIIAPAQGITETPTPSGRVISGIGSGAGGTPVTTYYILNGALVTYDVLTSNGPDLPIDEP